MSKKKFIDQFYFTNYKKHKSLAGKIHGRNFVVAGPNGAGKSSVFQGIGRLIGSMEEDQNPRVQITVGEDNGSAKVILIDGEDEYVVEERYTKGSRPRIKFSKVLKDGKRDDLKPAQERIQQIFGKVVDLTPLMDKKGPEQFVDLQKAFNIDISGHQDRRQNKFDDRTLVNRRIKELQAKLNSPELYITKADKEMYKEEKDAKVLLQQKIVTQAIQARINLAQLTVNKRKDIRQEIDNLDKEIRQLQERKAAKEKELELIRPVEIDKIKKELADAEETNKRIDEQIVTLSDHNKMVEKVKNYIANETKLQEELKLSKDYTDEINKMDAGLRKALSDIPFGEIFPGLELKYEYGEDGKPVRVGLYLNELPFHRSQQSYAEMVKCLIKLSIFINPEGLNFIYIGDWNLMDANNQNDLLNFAKDNDNVQLGIEKVENTAEIVLEFIEVA